MPGRIVNNPETNLRVLRRSRKQPEIGDLFAMQVPDGRYLFGRVIDVDLAGERSPTPNSHLLYIYNVLQHDKTIDFDKLTRDQLLLPPVHTNRLGWARGYFETIAHRSLRPSDVLEQHCFWDVITESYVDRKGRPLANPGGRCGTWGLISYLGIDDEVSDALGIPRAPADPDHIPGGARQRARRGRT